jgi:hypothetical protein
LQREEILVRLQVRITFDRDQQPSESAGQRILRILIFFELGRISDRRCVDFDLTCFGARLGYLRQYLAFLRRISLYRFDEVGNQIGTTLVLVLHIRPLRLRVFIIGRDVVDTAACQQQAGEHGKKGDLDTEGNTYCMAHAISPMGLLLRPKPCLVRWSLCPSCSLAALRFDFILVFLRANGIGHRERCQRVIEGVRSTVKSAGQRPVEIINVEKDVFLRGGEGPKFIR